MISILMYATYLKSTMEITEMKQHTPTRTTALLTTTQNGYIVRLDTYSGPVEYCYPTFLEAVNRIAREMHLLEIGEEIQKLVTNKEKV